MYVLCVLCSRCSDQLFPTLTNLLHLHLILRRICMRILRWIPSADRTPERRGRFLLNSMTGLVKGCACLVCGIEDEVFRDDGEDFDGEAVSLVCKGISAGLWDGWRTDLVTPLSNCLRRHRGLACRNAPATSGISSGNSRRWVHLSA